MTNFLIGCIVGIIIGVFVGSKSAAPITNISGGKQVIKDSPGAQISDINSEPQEKKRLINKLKFWRKKDD